MLKTPTSMPDKMRVQLSFATSGLRIITGVSAPQVWVATLNQPFGHAVNPQGWDQWANMYLKWRPVGMSLTLAVGIPASTATGALCMVRGYWSQYATGAGSDLAVIQNRFTKCEYVTNQSGFTTMKTSSRLHNVWGMSEQEWLTDDGTIADVTANPDKVTRYYYTFNCPDWTTGNDFTVRYEIRGTMDIEFSSARILLDA